MAFIQIIVAALFNWIRDLLAELLGRGIGAVVAERRKRRRRAKPVKNRPQKDAGNSLGRSTTTG